MDCIVNQKNEIFSFFFLTPCRKALRKRLSDTGAEDTKLPCPVCQWKKREIIK
jgi:hypothetical protein